MRNVCMALALVFVAAQAASAEAQYSDKVIRIGVMNDQSGVYASAAGRGSFVAAQFAAEDAGLNVNGVKVEVITADHQNKTDLGASIARKWYDVQGVDVIVDVGNSAISFAVQELAKAKSKLVLHVGSASADLTGKSCSPNGASWLYDTYAMARGFAQSAVQSGQDTWFLVVVDYAFGHAMEASIREVVTAAGGRVVGSVRHPLGTLDFSSFILQGQASKAKVLAFANAAGDNANAIKAASEFGVVKGGQKLGSLLMFIHDVHAMGLPTANGLQFVTGFYWDMSEETRAFARRHAAAMGGMMPTQVHAGVYSAVAHYLKSVKAAGSDEALAVMAKMRELPINDFFTRDAVLRRDGRVVRDMYFVEVKKPEESRHPWDYYKVLRTTPGNEAFRAEAEAGCPLVR